MTTDEMTDLGAYCTDVARRAARASRVLAQLRGDLKNQWLTESATELRQQADAIQEANQQDLAAAPDYGLTAAQIDRLQLTAARIADIARGLEDIAALPDPIGEMIESTVRPNGLEIAKVRVPLGVVFFIYESRPNVTADAAAICVKSGNAVILRGGKEAGTPARPSSICCSAPPLDVACPPTPCNWWPRPIARPSGTFCSCPSTSTWPFRAAAKV